MGAAKTVAKRRTVRRTVNRNQPAEVLKEKQKARIRALLAEKRRQEQMRKEFELFLAAQAANNNNNNWYFPELERKRRSTRKLRR